MTRVISIRSTAEQAARIAVVDEFGAIAQRLALRKPDEDRHGVLKTEIDGWYADAPADQPQVMDGKLFEVQLSSKRNERTVIDKRKAHAILRKRLGAEGVLAVLEIPLAVLEKHLTPAELLQVVHKDRTGYRNINVVALPPAELGKVA